MPFVDGLGHLLETSELQPPHLSSENILMVYCEEDISAPKLRMQDSTNHQCV